MDSHTLSEYIITQLMDSICNTTSDSIPVLHNIFIMEIRKSMCNTGNSLRYFHLWHQEF
jgi:hypothetical protein